MDSDVLGEVLLRHPEIGPVASEVQAEPSL
jgi:hypothetical protein